MSEIERLCSQLKRLSLHMMAQLFEEEAIKASKTEMSYTAFLARLVDEEVSAKIDRSVNARIGKARLPMLRTVDEFVLSFQPSLSAARLRELAELGFLERAENILFVGRPGVGKAHLSISLAVRACQSRKRVLFVQAMELLETLLAAGEELVTSNYVVLEAIAVTHRRLGLDAVRSLVEDMLPAVPVEWVDSTVHQVEVSSMLTAAQRHLCLVDCVSFELLRASHLRRVFGFDPHFRGQGSEYLP